MRLVSDQICREHGLTILKPYRQKKQVKGLRPGEYRSAMRGQSWKFQLIAVIEAAMERAGSREEFLDELRRRGYDARWEEVLRRTLALQETIRADTERLATKENLKELATGQHLVDWLNQINSIHQGICRDLRQTVQEMKEEHKQDGRRRDGFMRELSELEAQFRRNWDEASARFQGKILLTILASGIVSAMVSVLMWRVLL